MRFSSLVVYCFLYYDAVKKLFASWETEKSLLRIIFLFFFFFCGGFWESFLTLHWDACVHSCKKLQQVWKSLGFQYTGNNQRVD